jgi:hypothetical protein
MTAPTQRKLDRLRCLVAWGKIKVGLALVEESIRSEPPHPLLSFEIVGGRKNCPRGGMPIGTAGEGQFEAVSGWDLVVVPVWCL